jgi:hypothetical protein
MTNAPPITPRSPFLALPAFALFFQLMSGTDVQAEPGTSDPTYRIHITCEFVCKGSPPGPYNDSCMRDCARNYFGVNETPIPDPATTPYPPDRPVPERGSTPNPDDDDDP